jgi:cob(I)alamin adenosyltransferase
MKIYTKTGDDGTTGLHTGKRVPKYSLRVETYGTVDELNSLIGIVTTFEINPDLAEDLNILNNLLFNLGSDLATPFDPPPKFEIFRIGQKHIDWLEKKIDNYTEILPPLRNFILPGGSNVSAFFNLARTVCRRAERLCVKLSEEEDTGFFVLIFLNRLSDYLFVAARLANHFAGLEDIKWDKNIL